MEVNNDAMKHVAAFAGLEWLDLWHTRVTDAGLHDSLLKGLKEQTPMDTKITDAGRAPLGKLGKLRKVKPRPDEDLGARGLVYLKSLKNLKSLSLEQTKSYLRSPAGATTQGPAELQDQADIGGIGPTPNARWTSVPLRLAD